MSATLMTIHLSDEDRGEILQAIRHYFLQERGEEIGNLQAAFFLDFILAEIGPHIYNGAIRDAQTVLQSAVADLDATLYQAPPASGRTGRR